MSKIKINKKWKFTLIIFLFAILFCLLFVGKNSLARYVYLGLKDYYLETKSFYFNCDKMDNPEAFYQIDNWAGGGSFPITFNMNSQKNNMVSSTSDIYYSITYSCSSNVNCDSTKNSGVIAASSNTDFFVITLTPNTTLGEGDSVWLEVKAKSSAPYVKEISGKIVLNISIPGLSYQIHDELNQPYLNLEVTNTLDFYEIVTAFDGYAEGEHIDIATYMALSDENKAKCASAIIKLTFDPNVVLIDLTSAMYNNVVSSTQTTINGHQYINSITFKIDAISSQFVRFYKVNTNNDYTYPFVNETSVINFEKV